MSAAVKGTARLRNTAVSSRKETATTTPTNSGSFIERTVATSVKVAVSPPTRTRSALGPVAFGRIRARSAWTRFAVDTASGEPFGNRLATATWDRSEPPGRNVGVVALATSGSCAATAVAARNSARCAAEETCATSSIGPL